MSIREVYHSYGLLPYSELPDLTDPSWNLPPLIVECQGGDEQYVVALGLKHRADRGNPHHRALEENAASFAFITHKDKRVIFNEGGLWNEGGVWPLADSLDLAYAAGSESMWLARFGFETGIEVVSPELPNDGADLLLVEGFSMEEIACFYFVRQAPQWSRLVQRPDYRTYMAKKMEQAGNSLGWNFDFSFKNLVSIYEGIYNRRFDPTDTQFFLQQSVGYMLHPTSRIQEASVIHNMGRDVNLLELQLGYFNAGISSFTGFGMSHIMAVKPVLERLGTAEARYLSSEDVIKGLELPTSSMYSVSGREEQEYAAHVASAFAARVAILQT